MSRIPPGVIRAMLKFQLRMDVEDLQNAYRSALSGLVHRENEIEAMVRGQLGIGPEDDWPEPSEGEDDDPISLLYDHAGELDAQAKRGAPMVRKAFLIALFHAWERHCNARLKRDYYGLSAARGMIMRDGHATEWTAIRELQLAANCAKHGPGDSGRDLYAVRPDFFPKAKSAEQANERTLVINEDAMDRYFAAVYALSR